MQRPSQFTVAVVGAVAVSALVAGAGLVGQLAVAPLWGLAAVAAVAVVSVVAGGRLSARDGSTASVARLEERISAAARQRLEMRMRAETAGRFREEFVAAVRHELKTPLNAILGFTQVLLDEIDGPLTPQQREDVTAIRQAGQHLSELVEAVLAEWAPEREAHSPLEPVDLGTIAREVGRLLEGQAAAKPGVRVVVEVDPEVPRPRGDARRLRQVLLNLGTNALRATSRGSVTIGVAPDPEGVRVTVRDTGTGIPPEMIPRLFEEFSQGGAASSQVGGSGLGLALTRDLVEWHDGRIEVSSTPGAGSTFSVVLPLVPD